MTVMFPISTFVKPKHVNYKEVNDITTDIFVLVKFMGENLLI